MHIEVQVALNFVISYLYNKLPRRRVNIFGEELERALKDKFQGHWYPDKPFKGSAFRCLKTGDPVDKVLDRAARESGVPVQDILENLPQELAVWVDPGEVSYRIGEKGTVKILFTDKGDPQDERSADREVTKTFNPEAQCFRPIECVSSSLNGLSLSPKAVTPFPPHQPPHQPPHHLQLHQPPSASMPGVPTPPSATLRRLASPAPSPTQLGGYAKGTPSPVPPFMPRSTAPLTFTTATFAQTKFGSTKLKTSSKRANRMSPTEFSNYIKQRAMQQQAHPPTGGRALSPDPAAFYYPPYPPPFAPRPPFEPDALAAAQQQPFEPPHYRPVVGVGAAQSAPGGGRDAADDGGWAYPNAGRYQHLLVAN